MLAAALLVVLSGCTDRSSPREAEDAASDAEAVEDEGAVELDEGPAVPDGAVRVTVDNDHVLAETDKWAAGVEEQVAAHAPSAQIWLGETGSSYCGGQPGVSDRFAGSLWWLDELGRLARRGHRVLVRQTLSGSDSYAFVSGS